jgi:hypothetical protein
MQPRRMGTSISEKRRHVSERGWTTNTYLPVVPHVAVMTLSPGRFDAHAQLPSNESIFPTLISAPDKLSKGSLLKILTEAISYSDLRSNMNHSFALLLSVWKKLLVSPSTANDADRQGSVSCAMGVGPQWGTAITGSFKQGEEDSHGLQVRAFVGHLGCHFV